jgi:hypothetical protein
MATHNDTRQQAERTVALVKAAVERIHELLRDGPVLSRKLNHEILNVLGLPQHLYTRARQTAGIDSYRHVGDKSGKTRWFVDYKDQRTQPPTKPPEKQQPPRPDKPRPKRILTEHLCQDCGKQMFLRDGKYGPFLGCSGYPNCRVTWSVDDDGNPLPPQTKPQTAKTPTPPPPHQIGQYVVGVVSDIWWDADEKMWRFSIDEVSQQMSNLYKPNEN